MSKDYQKEVVEFLKPTSDKMGLTEARSVYGKEIAVGAKAVKALDAFQKSLDNLRNVIEKYENAKGAPAYDAKDDPYKELREMMGEFKRVKLEMRRCMDTLGNLDDYKREY